MRRLALGSLLLMVALAPTAHAAFPGANGRIAFVRGERHLRRCSPDGSGTTDLVPGSGTVDRHPAWSPDGNKIAFSAQLRRKQTSGLYVMNADGTGADSGSRRPRCSINIRPGHRTARSSVFARSEGDSNCFQIDCGDIVTINVDGTNLQPVTGRRTGQRAGLGAGRPADRLPQAHRMHRATSECTWDLVLVDSRTGRMTTTLVHNGQANRLTELVFRRPPDSSTARPSTRAAWARSTRSDRDGTGMTQPDAELLRSSCRHRGSSRLDPAWAPDGTEIAFRALTRGATATDSRIDPDGSND